MDLPTPGGPETRQIPVTIGAEPTKINIEVADELPQVADRLKFAQLCVNFVNVTVEDSIEVALNGKVLQDCPVGTYMRSVSDSSLFIASGLETPACGRLGILVP